MLTQLLHRIGDFFFCPLGKSKDFYDPKRRGDRRYFLLSGDNFHTVCTLCKLGVAVRICYEKSTRITLSSLKTASLSLVVKYGNFLAQDIH